MTATLTPSSHALEHLAWAALPEEVIIKRLVNKLVRANKRWVRGKKGGIRDAVRESCPPRGFLQSRLEGVIEELPLQWAIFEKRIGNQPIDWPKWRPDHKQARRDEVARRALGNENLTSRDLQHWNGHLLLLCQLWGEGNRHFLFVRHPGGKITRTLMAGRWVDSVAGAVAAKFPVLANMAAVGGSHLYVDFCQGVVTAHHIDDTTSEGCWAIKTQDGEETCLSPCWSGNSA